MLRLLGIDPRVFWALVRAFILMDLRGQHYAVAVDSKPLYVLSPLFIVIGQFLAASAFLCGFLHSRVDVYFFAFANLSMGMLLLATSVVVEFQEVALSPRDLSILGPRPITPRTYAAARLANLLFYFVLAFLALTIIPAISGASLRDAGWWYGPAFALASLAGNLAALAVVVLVMASLAPYDQLQGLRAVLSWSQIIALAFVFFGGQALLRGGGFWNVQVFGAFPPPWVRYLPTYWLARFIEEASAAPDTRLLWYALALVGVCLVSCLATALRLALLYRDMRPVEQAAAANRPMPADRLGGLGGSGWVAWTPEQRVGYWMGLTFLRRDPALTMRCLYAFYFALVVAIVGMATRQFADPMRGDPAKAALAVLAVFLVPMGAPNLVFNLAYSRDSAGGWLLRTAPVARPLDLARGACKAVMLWVVTPLCVVLGAAAGVAWGDPISAALHALLAWGLTWVFILASLWLVCPALPFSLPPARGGGLALPPLPLLALGTVATALGVIHAVAAPHPVYWLAVFAALPLAGWLVSLRAERWMASLGAPA